METFQRFDGADVRAMRWVRTSDPTQTFELRAGDVLLARLAWAKGTGSLARATLADTTWSLKRGGFLQPHVTVRDPEGKDLARLAMHLSRGDLAIVGDGNYGFRRAGLLVPAWQFTDAAGRALAHLEPVAERSRLQGGLLQAGPSLVADPALPLLAVVGWYFVVLAWFEDEAIRASETVLTDLSG